MASVDQSENRDSVSEAEPTEVSASEREQKANLESVSVAKSLVSAPNLALLLFLLAAISLCGHRWQCKHSSPCEQPDDLKNHMHGLHLPVPCKQEPWLGRPSGGGRPGGGRTPAGSNSRGELGTGSSCAGKVSLGISSFRGITFPSELCAAERNVSPTGSTFRGACSTPCVTLMLTSCM